MLIDFHTHINKYSDSDIFSVRSYSVSETIDLKTKHYSVGWHPWHLLDLDKETAFDILEKQVQCDEAIMVGECGLDKIADIPFSLQKEFFEHQIKLSEKYSKPLVLHCVRSFSELIEIKKHFKPKQQWVVHGFSNNINIAQMLVKEGIMLSFGKNVLTENSNAQKILSQIGDMPFFLETDDTDLHIEEIYDKVLKLTNYGFEELSDKITKSLEHIIHQKISHL